MLAELSGDRRKKLVIVEVGCGLRVPTVRRNSERLLKKTARYGTQLIRINPDRPENRKTPEATISIRASCLNALLHIDALISAKCAEAGAPATSASR